MLCLACLITIFFKHVIKKDVYVQLNHKNMHIFTFSYIQVNIQRQKHICMISPLAMLLHWLPNPIWCELKYTHDLLTDAWSMKLYRKWFWEHWENIFYNICTMLCLASERTLLSKMWFKSCFNIAEGVLRMFRECFLAIKLIMKNGAICTSKVVAIHHV